MVKRNCGPLLRFDLQRVGAQTVNVPAIALRRETFPKPAGALLCRAIFMSLASRDDLHPGVVPAVG